MTLLERHKPEYRARYYDPQIGRFLNEDPLGFDSDDFNLYAYVGNAPVTYTDPFGYARKPGKTPNKRWPRLPENICGKKPKWNPEGYWEGKGRRITWDDRSHGTGIDRGDGAQDGHWDDETSNNRWDKDGNLLPGSEALASPSNNTSPVPQEPQRSLPPAPNTANIATVSTAMMIVYILASVLGGQWN